MKPVARLLVTLLAAFGAIFAATTAHAAPGTAVLQGDAKKGAPAATACQACHVADGSRGAVTFPMDQTVATLTVLLDEFDRRLRGADMVRGDSQTIESRSFRQWTGSATAGSSITISYPGSVTGWLLPLLLGIGSVVLIGFTIRTLRRRPAPAGSGPAALLEELARMDQRYRGREAAVDQAEWARYQAERSRLKAAVSSHLAGTSKRS